MTNLYTPYRAIGYISDGNPFCMNYLGEELFITVSLQNSFQVIRYNKLVTCLVSKSVDDDGVGGVDDRGSRGRVINAIQVNGHDTFVAVDKEVIVYDRLNIVRRYNDHSHRIIGLLSIGHILISYDVGNQIKVSLSLCSKLHTITRSSAFTAYIYHYCFLDL